MTGPTADDYREQFAEALTRYGHDPTALLRTPGRSPLRVARDLGVPEQHLSGAFETIRYPIVYTVTEENRGPGMHVGVLGDQLVWVADDPFSPEAVATCGIAAFYGRAQATLPLAAPSTATAPDPRDTMQPTTVMQTLWVLGFGDIQPGELNQSNYHEELLRQGRITHEQLAQAYARLTAFPYIDVRRDPPHVDVRNALSDSLVRRHKIIPHSRDSQQRLVLLTSNPTDTFASSAAEDEIQRPVTMAVTSTPEIDRLINELYVRAAQDEALQREASSRMQTAAVTEVVLDPDNVVVQRIETSIREAVANDASDLHFQPEKGGLVIRQRTHGNLIERGTIPSELRTQVINRLKYLCGMVIESKLPQDKRIAMPLVIGGKPQELRMRVSSLPSNYGDSIVLRLLRDVASLPSLDDMQFSPRNREIIEDAMGASSGMVLVTGPTGSGKTTLMHVMLRRLNTNDIKILAIEDPIEYEQPGIVQTEIRITDDPATSLTFPRVLRAQLRHDPNVIFVGEIRDGDTAAVSAQASQTGHLLLSTLHTNSALATVTRLMDLGLPPYLIAESLRAVIAQRLVGQPCPECSVEEPMPDQYAPTAGATMRRGTGRRLDGSGLHCPLCQGTGTYKVIPIHEVLHMGDDAREAIAARDMVMLGNHARADGMRSLREDGLDKVAQHRANLNSVLDATR